MLIQKGLDRQVVLYWYQSHGRVTASEYWGKIYTVLDAIRLNRTDAAMVRVISPVADGRRRPRRRPPSAPQPTSPHALFPLLNRLSSRNDSSFIRERAMSMRFRSAPGRRRVALAAASCSKDAKQYLENGNKYFRPAEVPRGRRRVPQRHPEGPAVTRDARLKLAESYEQARATTATRTRSTSGRPTCCRTTSTRSSRPETTSSGPRKYQDAATRADGVLKKDPRNVDALILKGNIAAELQDLDGALKQIEEAIEIDPKESRAYTNLGSLQGMKGNLQAAEQAFRQAVEVDPKSITRSLRLAISTSRPSGKPRPRRR